MMRSVKIKNELMTMTVTCNGACKNYKAEKKRDTKRYQNGDKFCGYCNIFIK